MIPFPGGTPAALAVESLKIQDLDEQIFRTLQMSFMLPATPTIVDFLDPKVSFVYVSPNSFMVSWRPNTLIFEPIYNCFGDTVSTIVLFKNNRFAF